MNASDTKLATISNGAMMGGDTKALLNLNPDAPERASYDDDIVKSRRTRTRDALAENLEGHTLAIPWRVDPPTVEDIKYNVSVT